MILDVRIQQCALQIMAKHVGLVRIPTNSTPMPFVKILTMLHVPLMMRRGKESKVMGMGIVHSTRAASPEAT
tara:strand:+ start:53 stop:268 length:216 start_codon:yes stop_codon:yes gene_type:complete